jgi:hypothetical protein
MARHPAEEIRAAFDHYQQVSHRAAQTGDWAPWAELFTLDAVYDEHHYGRFEGRDAIRDWITTTMSQWPTSAFRAFPVEWYSVDEDRGWVLAQIWNRLEDPGDGSVHQAYNLTVLHYAGDGRWSFKEDVYNPERFRRAVAGWLAARRSLGRPDGA